MYQTLIEQGQAFPVTYFNLGSIFLKKKDYNNAFLFYKEAIRVDPDYYKAHLWLGRLYNRFGKKEEALHEFKEAIRIFPQRWVSYLDTGDLLYSMKRFTEAEKVYQQALIFFPPERRGSSEYGVIQERLRALRLQPVE
jgi:tetratricopeptide (TPR) repeat protein